MGFVDDYIKDVWRQKRLVPQYPPAGRVHVGDIYEKVDGVWSPRSDLKSIGFTPKLEKSNVGAVDVASQGKYSLSAKTKGETPAGVFAGVLGQAEAGVSVGFQGSFGYVMSMSGVTVTEMTNIDDLVAHIVSTNRWTWDLSFMIVTRVYTAKSTTLLTSGTSGAQAVLKAKADIAPRGVTVADLSVGLDYVAGSGIADRFASVPRMTPLWAGRKITLADMFLHGALKGRETKVSRSLLPDLAVKSLVAGDGQPVRLSVREVEFDPTKD